MRKRNLAKSLGVFAMLLLFLGMSPLTAKAEGWDNSSGSWRYLDKAGSAVSDTWRMSGDAWYYLGSDGTMLTDQIFDTDKGTYYVDSSGRMAASQWKEVASDNEEKGSSWYYFGEDGRAYKGKEDRVYTREIDGKRYLFDDNGVMITGYVGSDGNVVDADTEYPFRDATYYFGPDGAMYAAQWVQYESVGEANLYSELAQRNYREYEQMWLYFDENGKKMYAKPGDNSKQKEINGQKYLFDENGVMIPQLSVATRNATPSNSKAEIKYGSQDNDGHLPSDYWTFTVPNQGMSEEDYDTGEYSWFRTKSDGAVIKDKIATVLGRKYSFDKIGRMQTGFVIMMENNRFGIKFDVDEWTKDDWLMDVDKSPIPAIDRGTLYLFGTDELNDGSMITGEVKVNIRGEEVVFGFKENGKAIGNGGKLTRYKDKFYFNGLRLDADGSLGYGIVRDARASALSTNSYIVVDKNGKIVTGTKILKDGEDNWIIVQNSRFLARVSDSDKPKQKNGRFYHYDSSASRSDRWGAEITYATDGTNNLSSDFVLYE